MERFQIIKQTAILGFQSRTELAGDERKTAASLHLACTVPNDMLALFDKGLKASFYRKQLKEEQDLADQGAGPNEGLNRIKFPRANNVIEWDDKYTSYTLTVDFGIDDKTAIVMAECTADKFKLEMKDGGTVGLSFRVAAHPDEEQAGKLHTLNGSEVTFTLKPGDDGQQELA